MKEKILSAIFMTSFALTGCGIESIFDDGLPCWLLAFATAIVSAYFLFCYKD